MKKILIIGSEGQLGSTFKEKAGKHTQFEFSFSTIEELDLTSDISIKHYFSDKKFDYLINCAAYTSVDKAEEDREAAFRLNAEAPGKLASEAVGMNAIFFHISTDYVFDGNNFRPLKPSDPKNPESVYGQSKLKGEEAVMAACPESIIIRTSWLYSAYGQNFMKTILRLGKERDSINVVFDQAGTPTLANDLADAILSIIQTTHEDRNNFFPGIYHFSNEGVCSWYDFAISILKYAQINCNVYPVESDQFPTPAPRPYYSVMDKSLIKNTFNLSIPHWQGSLERCINQL